MRARIASAAARAGKDPASVRIVGVTKTHPVEICAEAFAAGISDLGESYIQEWTAKCDAAPAEIRWHLIGRIQRRKAKEIARRAGRVALVHSLDDLDLAEALDRRLVEANARLACLVEVHATDEPEKGGVAPGELASFLSALRAFPRLDIRGLLAMGPRASQDDPEASRSAFRLAAELARANGLPELSMGMSGDLEVAVETGATIVRIGTDLFGVRGAS